MDQRKRPYEWSYDDREAVKKEGKPVAAFYGALCRALEARGFIFRYNGDDDNEDEELEQMALMAKALKEMEP